MLVERRENPLRMPRDPRDSAPAIERLEEGHDRGGEAVRLLHPDHVRDVVPDDRAGIRGVRLEMRWRWRSTSLKSRAPPMARTGQRNLGQALVRDRVELDLAALHAARVVERQVHLGRGARGRRRGGGPQAGPDRHPRRRSRSRSGRRHRTARPGRRLRTPRRSPALPGVSPPSNPPTPAATPTTATTRSGDSIAVSKASDPPRELPTRAARSDAVGVHDGAQVGARRELDVLGRRSAVTARVVADDPVAGRDERRDHRVPRAQVGDAGMEQQDRRARAVIDDVQAASGNIDRTCRACPEDSGRSGSRASHRDAARPGPGLWFQPSRAIGSRSIVRTWRVRPASVRTSAAGMTPEVSFSITAASPA